MVIISNIRGFGLLTVEPGYKATGPIPPQKRRLEQTVNLWASVTAFKNGKKADDSAIDSLAMLVESAVTDYAPIAEPETLARVLAR